MRSLVAIPQYDQGVALNMVIALREEPAGFAAEQLPEMVWTTNLFGRATHNLVLAEQLQTAYDEVDRELRAVADIQRSLLAGRIAADSAHGPGRPLSDRRAGPAATTTISFRCPTDGGAS